MDKKADRILELKGRFELMALNGSVPHMYLKDVQSNEIYILKFPESFFERVIWKENNNISNIGHINDSKFHIGKVPDSYLIYCPTKYVKKSNLLYCELDLENAEVETIFKKDEDIIIYRESDKGVNLRWRSGVLDFKDIE